MKTRLGVMICVLSCGLTFVHAEEETPLTWADFHMGLSRTFARQPVPWVCQPLATQFPAAQPVVVRAPGGELIANAGTALIHSVDGGRSWQQLGEIPVDRRVPTGFKLLSLNLDGCGVTEQGTLLFHYTKQFNRGQPYDSFAEAFHAECHILRSTDRGRTWEPAKRLLSQGFNCVGTGRARFVRLPGGVIGLPMETWNAARQESPVPDSQKWFQAFLYISSDDGRS